MYHKKQTQHQAVMEERVLNILTGLVGVFIIAIAVIIVRMVR